MHSKCKLVENPNLSRVHLSRKIVGMNGLIQIMIVFHDVMIYHCLISLFRVFNQMCIIVYLQHDSLLSYIPSLPISLSLNVPVYLHLIFLLSPSFVKVTCK